MSIRRAKVKLLERPILLERFMLLERSIMLERSVLLDRSIIGWCVTTLVTHMSGCDLVITQLGIK